MLQPVFSCPDPIRGGDDVLVMCEVLLPDMTPHPTNTRALLRPVAEKYADQEPLFGIEQEYTFFKDGRPLGFPPSGFPAPQGFYYCGVGADEVFGRDVVEAHLDACLDAGLGISGINAEVMPGQWEFQVGPLSPLDVSRPAVGGPLAALPHRRGLRRSRATLDPKPIKGDWNGAGAHTNFSTKAMREGYDADHHGVRGAREERRGARRRTTAPTSSTASPASTRPRRGHEFSYGVSDRGASVRIPWQVEMDKKGYIEDRRPNANMDPYVVTPAHHRDVLQRARRRTRASTRSRAALAHGARFAARISWPVRRALSISRREADDPWRLLAMC